MVSLSKMGTAKVEMLHVILKQIKEQKKKDLRTRQGLVTYMYMSRVEAFVTEIKIEPSNQSPFGRPIKGSR